MSKSIAIIALALAAAAPAPTVHAFSGGPPDGHTNAPGEANCTACHATFALNSGAGSLAVTGVPGSWIPLAEYDLQVTLADPVAQRWGFQCTVLDGSGVSVGTLATVDTDAQLSTTGNRVYAKHTSAGTHLGTTVSHTWTVRWTAPAAGTGDVTVYVAGNAANGNFANTGDRIYATSATWIEDVVSGVPDAAVAQLGGNFPNPFNPRTTIGYHLETDLPVRLTVYAVDGRLVRRLEDGRRAAGEHVVVWDGLDGAGRAVPSGTYLYRLEAGALRETRTMTLLR